MSENISRFEYLSVREAQGAKIIKEICNKEARVVLDPTMLLSACEWDKLAIGENESKPYILCYFLGTNKDNWSHVYRLSEKINIPLKIIPVFTSDYGRGYEVVNGVGPGEFINLVRNASMICTDSFMVQYFLLFIINLSMLMKDFQAMMITVRIPGFIISLNY